jgi:hypothetical protein
LVHLDNCKPVCYCRDIVLASRRVIRMLEIYGIVQSELDQLLDQLSLNSIP